MKLILLPGLFYYNNLSIILCFYNLYKLILLLLILLINFFKLYTIILIIKEKGKHNTIIQITTNTGFLGK